LDPHGPDLRQGVPLACDQRSGTWAQDALRQSRGPTPFPWTVDLVARQRHGSKSALFEEAIRANLEPQQVFGAEESLARGLHDLNRSVGAMARDLAIIAESLALYVRYFLTMTPPLRESEQQAAHLLGRERFQVFLAQVGRRLASDRRLASEVLRTIAVDNPDLLATAADDAPLRTAASQDAKTDGDAEQPSSPAPRARHLNSTRAMPRFAPKPGSLVLFPRVVCSRDAHGYLGMDCNRFNSEVMAFRWSAVKRLRSPGQQCDHG
jgi:hypothetical protein